MVSDVQAQSPQEARAGTKTRPCSRRGLLIFVLLLLFYFLSTGPAHRLVLRHILPESALSVYVPLRTLSKHFSPAKAFFVWYVHDVWRCWWPED
jgi:hypothetical protein